MKEKQKPNAPKKTEKGFLIFLILFVIAIFGSLVFCLERSKVKNLKITEKNLQENLAKTKNNSIQ